MFSSSATLVTWPLPNLSSVASRDTLSPISGSGDLSLSLRDLSFCLLATLLSSLCDPSSSSSSLLSILADFLEGELLSGNDLISVASEASETSSSSNLKQKISINKSDAYGIR